MNPTLYDDEVGFQQAIGENPTESTHHGAYADWLDERGRHGDAAFRRAMSDWLSTRPVGRTRTGRELKVTPEALPPWASQGALDRLIDQGVEASNATTDWHGRIPEPLDTANPEHHAAIRELGPEAAALVDAWQNYEQNWTVDTGRRFRSDVIPARRLNDGSWRWGDDAGYHWEHWRALEEAMRRLWNTHLESQVGG